MNDGGLLDTVLGNFTGAISGSWGPSLSGYLLPLLMALVCLQFGMMAIEAFVGRDIPLVIIHIMLGILRVGIVVAVYQHAFDWGQDITQTFQQVGGNIAGFTASTGPSEIFDYGGQLVTAITSAKASGSWLSELFENIEFFVIAVMVGACWAVACLIYLGTLIEVVLLVYAGPLIICVTPLSWTFDLFITWARSVLSIGFKVALILLTLGVGTLLAQQWVAAVGGMAITFTTDLTPFLIPLIESAILVFVVWKVPNRLSGLAPGAAILGFGEAVSGMASSAAGNALNSSGSSSSGGGGSGGSVSSSGGGGGSDGWAVQGARAMANAAKALAQKVQDKLTA